MTSGAIAMAAYPLISKFKAIKKDEADTCRLMLMDINSFKEINDSFGHTAGDDAII